MKIWVKNFGYHKKKKYQFFETEICINREAMKLEDDFSSSSEFVSIGELNQLKSQLADYEKALIDISNHVEVFKFEERYPIQEVVREVLVKYKAILSDE